MRDCFGKGIEPGIDIQGRVTEKEFLVKRERACEHLDWRR